MNFVLLPVTFAALCFFFTGAKLCTAIDSSFFGSSSSSAMASVRRVSVRMRSMCSMHCSTCGSISACDCGLTSMTTVGFSSPVSLTRNWSLQHLGTVAQIPCTIDKGAAGRRNKD